MNPIVVGLIAFACLFGAALLGMRLRATLPEHHMSDDSRHLLQTGLGIIGTMAGLVLGLLVASATTSYNAQRNEVDDVSSKVVLLDRVLAQDMGFLDAVQQGVFTVPGDGCIAFTPLLRRLRDSEYAGWLVVEAEQDPRKAHPLTYARLGHSNLRALAQEAGFEVT